MKIDLSEKISLTRWNLIQITLVSMALAAGLTIFETIMGFVFIGLTILVLAAPIFAKVFGGITKDETDI